MKLNLGCGSDIRKGWVNVDKVQMDDGVYMYDLNCLPWPWEDCESSYIAAVSVFEHLRLDLVQTLDECWRVLEDGGTLYVKYPLHTSKFIHDDPTHRWYWSKKTFEYFDPRTKYGQEYSFILLENGT